MNAINKTEKARQKSRQNIMAALFPPLEAYRMGNQYLPELYPFTPEADTNFDLVFCMVNSHLVSPWLSVAVRPAIILSQVSQYPSLCGVRLVIKFLQALFKVVFYCYMYALGLSMSTACRRRWLGK